MSLIGSFRQAVQTELQSDLGVPFVAGKIEGPSESEDIGCCWPERISEMSSDVDVEQLEVRARVFLKYQVPEPGLPYDPAPLEDLVERVQLSLVDKQTALGPWYVRITDVNFDVDLQAVEAVIVGWSNNIGTRGG